MGAFVSHAVTSTRLLRQYLYFCTSKASKLSAEELARNSSVDAGALELVSRNISICTPVPVKQVNSVDAGAVELVSRNIGICTSVPVKQVNSVDAGAVELSSAER